MTRLILAFAALSVAAVAFDPAGYRWAGLLGLTFVAALLALRLRAAILRKAARRTLEGLRALHPSDFEAEVARWLRRDGWQVEHRGGTGDGGIDILARKRSATLAVQCKRYAETAAVSSAQVRDLYGAAVAEGATAAVLVTTGRVSRAARSWCEALQGGPVVRLVEADHLASVARRSAPLA